MSDTSTLTSGVAGRYATALFEFALENDALEETERDLAALKAALADSPELKSVIVSPLYDRAEQGNAMAAVGEAMGLGTTVRNLIGLMAAKRRLFALPQVIDMVARLAAEHRGEITAEVTAARPLSDAQTAALKEQLAGATDRTVKLNVTVDPGLIGGLVVKLGSRMIDTSIRSKLMGLQTAMKEVG